MYGDSIRFKVKRMQDECIHGEKQRKCTNRAKITPYEKIVKIPIIVSRQPYTYTTFNIEY